ncbi:MAG: alkaline phosphatase D family protein, partial [Planctomycetales bacterium]|nr:alkaline phosphatase D family protein [Planctomycetales bacterium]
MNRPTRRVALQTIGSASAALGVGGLAAGQENSARQAVGSDWSQTFDRVWLGGEYWANPMEDWRIVDGAAECQSTAGGRTVHWLTRQITDAQAEFEMSVRLRRVARQDADGSTQEIDGGAGFSLGAMSDIGEYRSSCFVRGKIDAGLRQGKLFVAQRQVDFDADPAAQDVTLTLHGRPNGGRCQLTLTAQAGEKRASISASVEAAQVLGNVALANNFSPPGNKAAGGRYRFSKWTASGPAFTVEPEQRFGPILWSMYSLSDSRGSDGWVMKLSALTGPLGEQDNTQVELFIDAGDRWQSLGKATLDRDAWTATFRIAHWDETRETKYRLVYQEKHRDGTQTASEWQGTIQANPVGRPLRMAALTCQHAYGFPYEPVANNVRKLKPDLAYFSGDQLYEGNGGFGFIREPAEPAILCYLRKFYMFGWAFREVMRDTPTLCIPDDHDVFQGNIWGEGGAAMQGIDVSASSKGGYREPARMVNVVHKTNVSHHPDAYDARPVQQGISVYYGDMVYGNVGFAIIADRQFKSGPERVNTGGGRADHVPDKDFDTSKLDKPGLILLGERQEAFLEQWGRDWRGHELKVLLSQTVFAGVATHHGSYDGYLKADLDCGGWPQTARNRTVRLIREGMPLHINGDQHVTTLVQYGSDSQRDSCWSFCPPAIAVSYPRWWRPDELGMPHKNRPAHNLPNTGEFVDGLGNKVYVYAVGNPQVGQ